MAQQETWLERAAPLTGIVFVALSIVGLSIASTGVDFLASGEELASFYEDNDARVTTGGALGTIAVAFLLWFLGSLWRTLRDAEDRSRLSVVAFGGGVAGALTLLIGSTLAIVAGARAGEAGTIEPAVAEVYYDFSGFLWGVTAPVAFAVLIGATALLTIRRGIFPAWWGWVSGLLAVALLVLPISWAAFIGAYVWVLVMSVWLYARGGAAAGIPAAAEPGGESAVA